MPAAKKAPPAPKVESIHDAMQQARIELCGAGIEKERQAPAAVGGYKFRGIDDIYNVIGPLMAKYGITMTPNVVNLDKATYEDEVTKRGNNGNYVVKRRIQHYVIQVQYFLTVAGDEQSMAACVFGEAMDTADKAMNKAMTSAYKNAVFQLFAPPLSATPIDMDDEAGQPELEQPMAPPKQEAPAAPAEPAAPESGIDPTGSSNVGAAAQQGLISVEDANSVKMARANAGIEESAFFQWIKVPTGRYDQIPAAKLAKIEEVLKEKIREKSVADAKALADQKSVGDDSDNFDDDIPF